GGGGGGGGRGWGGVGGGGGASSTTAGRHPLSPHEPGGAQKGAPAAARGRCHSVALNDQRPPRRSCHGCPYLGLRGHKNSLLYLKMAFNSSLYVPFMMPLGTMRPCQYLIFSKA